LEFFLRAEDRVNEAMFIGAFGLTGLTLTRQAAEERREPYERR
jgi:hypothetical protein